MGGHADAEFTDFMAGSWARLVRLGYVLTGDHGLAEDLAQTALARAYASWPRVVRAGDPEAYVRKIVVNASRDRFRGRRVQELLRLPAGQRAVVLLRYWLDLTETEAAAVLGCSVGNVKSQASRALAKLRLSAEITDLGLADEVSHDHG